MLAKIIKFYIEFYFVMLPKFKQIVIYCSIIIFLDAVTVKQNYRASNLPFLFFS